jgi:hypothetical protein
VHHSPNSGFAPEPAEPARVSFFENAGRFEYPRFTNSLRPAYSFRRSLRQINVSTCSISKALSGRNQGKSQAMRISLKVIGAIALIGAAFAPRVALAQNVNGTRSSQLQLSFSRDPQNASANVAQLPAYACSVSTTFSAGDSPAPVSGAPLGLTMADFTGDSHPDLATLELDRLEPSTAHYFLEIQLTEGGRQALRLTAPTPRLVVTAKDVTGDGSLDLIIQTADTRAPVAVFLNDGCGHFSARDSSRFGGAPRDIRNSSDVAPAHLQYGFAAAYRGPSSAEPHAASGSFLHTTSSGDFPARESAPPQLFLPLRTNRAPPALV